MAREGTGDAELDRLLRQVLDASGAHHNRDQLFDILVSATGLARDRADRLDLKITNAALKEMRLAFNLFAPYRQTPKITMFGSARTLPDDPLYLQARDLAAALAGRGWMVVTGAGPGIMAAGMEGAGREMSFGVNIRLPFEQGANPFIEGDKKLIEMRYFFTRKLMLMKESDGFVVLPGGFGTLDEAFELLTLLQTGKADPAPIVFLEVPGGTYWHTWERFLLDEVEARGLVSEDDRDLYLVTDDVQKAADEILGFYRNYHSIRYVNDVLLVRIRNRPTPAEVDRLASDFADIVLDGRIEAVEALPVEVAENDNVDLTRLRINFDRVHHGRLRALINAVNNLASAPAVPATPPRPTA